MKIINVFCDSAINSQNWLNLCVDELVSINLFVIYKNIFPDMLDGWFQTQQIGNVCCLPLQVSLQFVPYVLLTFK